MELGKHGGRIARRYQSTIALTSCALLQPSLWHSHSWLCSSLTFSVGQQALLYQGWLRMIITELEKSSIYMSFYQRNLPHWQPDGASIFLTWRLHGSLLPSPNTTARSGCATKPSQTKNTPGRVFKLLDAVLDRATTGPFWLKDPRIASCVVDAILRGQNVLGQYTLHSFVVMPNHVHLLITPSIFLRRITNGLKGVTARESNRILGRQGKHFWQDESFDHWVRTPAEFNRIRSYIEGNPVSAGLASKPEGWPWSSAASRASLPSGAFL